MTGTARTPDLPDVPTMLESGLPNVTTVTYYGFMAAAGVPASVVGRLNSEVNDCLRSTEFSAAMVKLGFGPRGGTPQEFAALIAEQAQKWAPIVKATAFQME
jgi:tripartite-type tricarboxylate transporter receptor subunit TctC